MFIFIALMREGSLVNDKSGPRYHVGYAFACLCAAWPFSVISLLWFCLHNTLCNCRITYVAYFKFGAR